jgi:hypothetical protein
MNELTVPKQAGTPSRLQFAFCNPCISAPKPNSGPEAWCDSRILSSSDRLAADLSDVIPQALFDIARFVKA